MIFQEALPFINDYLQELDESILQHDKSASLSKTQRMWIGFCLMGILVTNHICWAKFERASLGLYSEQALSWMFTKSKIMWEKLLIHSTKIMLKKYGIKSGVLLIDDTDKKRSKRTKRISKAHKIYDKKTGGYFNGQSIIFLFLVTDKISIPVGFRFYRPDPNIKKWKQKEKELKAQGVLKNDRPEKPERSADCPTIENIAVLLVKEFKTNHPDIKVKAILADALYGTSNFFCKIHKIYKNTQVISQAKKSQNVELKSGKLISIEAYFVRNPGVKKIVSIRGNDPVCVTMHGARLKLAAHGKKRYIIALKYEGEDEYRYIVASELAWRLQDIVECYSLRWLIEVFIQDWKANEGWGNAIKLLDDEGSSRGLILSLLFDHCLLFHDTQHALVESKLSASTVGSLLERTRMEALVCFIKNILFSKNPLRLFDDIKTKINEFFPLRPSSKHMNGRELGRMEETPSLKYKKEWTLAPSVKSEATAY